MVTRPAGPRTHTSSPSPAPAGAYALVLAAGSSSRFGGDKLLAPWRGRPLVAHALAAVSAAIDAGSLTGGCVVVPLGQRELLRLTREAGLDVVENPAPAAGLSSSLRLGIARLERTAPPDRPRAAVIFLGDQPLVRPDVVAKLTAAWHGERLAAVRPRYAETPNEPGHPLLIDGSLWILARSLVHDAGFGPALSAHGVAVTSVDVPGRNPDVDTPADLGNLPLPES
ncbi:MAG TPA: nucleotidyltransferase family protein [Gemmatimonadales bacterium]|nr:nucleotidyltransferase family protein [Gemmatimonadales bacterium]